MKQLLLEEAIKIFYLHLYVGMKSYVSWTTNNEGLQLSADHKVQNRYGPGISGEIYQIKADSDLGYSGNLCNRTTDGYQAFSKTRSDLSQPDF